MMKAQVVLKVYFMVFCSTAKGALWSFALRAGGTVCFEFYNGRVASSVLATDLRISFWPHLTD